MGLAQEFLGPIGHEINPVLILERDLLPVSVPDRPLIGMRCPFKFVGAFPQIEKSTAILRPDIASAAALFGGARSKMPFAQKIRCVSSFAELDRQGWQCRI